MKRIYLIIIITVAATSCKTYYMTPNSLKQQLQDIDPNKISDAYDFRLGLIGVVFKGGKNFYNGIDSIKVSDKNGKKLEIPVSTNTSVRLTDKKDRRVSLYFDSMFIRDSLVYGSRSHYITLPITPMNVDNLTKIEIQKE